MRLVTWLVEADGEAKDVAILATANHKVARTGQTAATILSP